MATPARKLEIPGSNLAEFSVEKPKEDLLAGKKILEANIRLSMYGEALEKAEKALREIMYSGPSTQNEIDWEIYDPNSMVTEDKSGGALQKLGRKIDSVVGVVQETGLDEYTKQLENQVRSPESTARLESYRQKLTTEKEGIENVLKTYANIAAQRKKLESSVGGNMLLASKMHLLGLHYENFQAEIEKAQRILPAIGQQLMGIEEALHLEIANDVPGMPVGAPQDKTLAELEKKYRKLVDELRHRKSSEKRVYKNANEKQEMIKNLEEAIRSAVLERRQRLELIQNGGDDEHKENLKRAGKKHEAEEASFQAASKERTAYDLNKPARNSTIEDKNISAKEAELKRNIRKVMGDDIRTRRIDKLPKPQPVADDTL